MKIYPVKSKCGMGCRWIRWLLDGDSGAKSGWWREEGGREEEGWEEGDAKHETMKHSASDADCAWKDWSPWRTMQHFLRQDELIRRHGEWTWVKRTARSLCLSMAGGMMVCLRFHRSKSVWAAVCVLVLCWLYIFPVYRMPSDKDIVEEVLRTGQTWSKNQTGIDLYRYQIHAMHKIRHDFSFWLLYNAVNPSILNCTLLVWSVCLSVCPSAGS